jgi:hypothetical protein
MTRSTLAFTEEESLARGRVSSRRNVISRGIQRMNPQRERSQLVLWQWKGRHTALTAIPDQIVDLFLGTASQHPVIH